ncbi:hypothetical protein PENSPDRAFT_756842 [Peniophora sp. CONT]|nr:hypothetical protein PENSPDRAFT_756842 [Peniophora sp. CONT]
MSVRNRERPAGRLLGPRTRAPTSPLPAPPAQLTQAQPAFVPPPPPLPTTYSPEPEPTQDNNEVMPSYAQSQDAYARSPQPPQPEPQPSASQPSPPPTARPPEPQRKNTADAPSSSSPAPLARRDTTASIGPPAYSAHPHPHQPHPRAPPPLSPTHAHGQLLPSIPPPPPLQHMQPPTSATGATFLVPPRGSPAHTNGSLPSVPPTPTTPAHPHSRPSTAASSYPNSNNSTPTPTLAPAPTHSQRPTTTSQSQRPGTATLKRAVVPPRPPLPPLPQIDLAPSPIPYKHLTLDAAQWTLSSADLQALVSAAIRESARERSIRLLAPNVQGEIDARLRALESEWDNAAAGWRFEGYRRGMLLSAIQSLASSLPLPPTSTNTNTLSGAPQPQSSSTDDSSDTEALHALLGQLHAAMGRMDSHAGSLLAAAHARAGCERAVGTHKSSALAVALRKLNASYARRTKELGRERDRRLVAEGEVDEAWRVAEEVAAEVDRLRAEKRAWEERERELTDALAAFSNPARGHRRGESSVSVGNGEGLRFVLTTEPEGGDGEGEEETRGRRLSLAMSEDVTSVSRLSRISRVSEAEVIPVTGKAVVSAARYVAGALSPTDEDSPSRLGDEVQGPIRETFGEGEGPTALIPGAGEEEGGAASVAASVGHGSDTEDDGQSVEVKTAKEDGDVPGTARPFPSTFHLPPPPSTSSPTAESSKGKEKAFTSPVPADLRPEHKRHKRASTTSQVSRVSAARTRSMRASKASLSVRAVGGGGQGEKRVRRRASSVSSVPESGYGVEVKGLGLGRRRRGSVDALKDSVKSVEKPVTVKTRERKDSDAFSIASASSAAASVQSRRREREKERMRAPPPVPALPVAGAEGEGEGEEGSFLELGMMDATEGENEGEKEGALGEGASASFRFSAPTPQHSYPPRMSASTSTSTSASRQSKPRRPRSPTTLTLLSAFVTPEGGIEDEEPGMSPAAPSSVAPFASVAPFPRDTAKEAEEEDVNGSTDILPSMSSSVSASAFASPASEHPPPESASRLGMGKLSIPHASGSGLANMGAGVNVGAGSPLSPSSSSAGGLAYLHTPASPAGPRAPGSHVRGISAPGPRVLAASASSPIQTQSLNRRAGEGKKGERTLTHSASQPLSGVVERERPKGAALRHSSAESGALVRSTTFGRGVKAGEEVQEQVTVASPEPMQGEESTLSVEAAQDFSSPSSESPPLHSRSPVHSQNPSTSSGAVHPYAPSPAQLNHAHSGSLASTRSSLGVVLENGSPDEFGLSLSSSPGLPVLRPSRSGTFNLTRYAAPNSALEDDQWARGASDEWSRDGLSFDSGASGSGLSKATVGEDEVTATSPLVPRRGHSLELPSPGSTDGGARVRRSMSELLRFGLIGRKRPGSSGGGSGGHGKSGSGSGSGGGSGGGKTPVKEHKDEGAEGILG